METQEKKLNRIRFHWSMWFLLAALLGLAVWFSASQNQSGAEISYSTFVNEVKAGNVSQVKIIGSEITGRFEKPIALSSIEAESLSTANPPTGISSQVASVSSPGQAEQSVSKEFRTYFPQAIGDPTLLPLLEAHNIEIRTASLPFQIPPLLLFVLSILLLTVVFIGWLVSQVLDGDDVGIFNRRHSKKNWDEITHPEITFDDIAGQNEAKVKLTQIVEFLRSPEKYFEAHIPHRILMVGPSGTGKSMLACAVAGEAGVPFFRINASKFLTSDVGEGARNLRDLFIKAKKTTPSVVLIEGIEALSQRNGNGLRDINGEAQKILYQLFIELNGIGEKQEIIVLAETNRPEIWNPALLGPGYFDHRVIVSLPDRKGREEILRIYTRRLHLGHNVNLPLIARTTTGFNGADLRDLCNHAALIAARENSEQVKMSDFEEALDGILIGEAHTILLDEHERNIVAYHEAGHALVAWFTPQADPILSLSLIPSITFSCLSGRLAGLDKGSYSQEQLRARLGVILAGRAAEEIALGDFTTMAENDLVDATRLARWMVTRWGMGSLGQMAWTSEGGQPTLDGEVNQTREYSEQTSARIDMDIQNLIGERYEAVRQLLTEMRPKLERMAQVLLQEETIDRDGIMRILGIREIGLDATSLSERQEIAQSH